MGKAAKFTIAEVKCCIKISLTGIDRECKIFTKIQYALFVPRMYALDNVLRIMT